MSKKVWLTYAWVDNENGDVDYIAQELENTGLTVKLDRWNIGAGKRLWEQIETFITTTTESDAWLLYATQASLSSEPCKEEYAYALDRALRARGDRFPVIGLFPSSVDPTLIPAGVRTRLCVSLTDPDWKERIKSAAEGRVPTISRATISPYVLSIHRFPERTVVEVRPRAGVWAPVIAAVPIAEREACKPTILVGPAGVVPGAGMLAAFDFVSDDGVWWVVGGEAQANPTMSLYVWLKQLPSRLLFGAAGGPQFQVSP